MAPLTPDREPDNISNIYQTLPIPAGGKCIRLLDILSPDESQTNGGPLRAKMRLANLDCDPSFTALSYVWGDQSLDNVDKTFIICGGYTLPVTANCHSALIHLRRQFQTFTIWVDAVSINQDNSGEKSQQIPLLGEIYSKARGVYVWLGEGNAATDRAMEYLGTTGFIEYLFADGDPNSPILSKPRVWAAAWTAFSAFARPSKHPFPFLTKDLTPWQFPFLRHRTIHSKSGRASYYDLNELLTRKWTKRIWTYQEIMLAQNPIIVCGNSHLSWSRFALSILFLDLIRAKRVANLGIPLNSTLETWKKIILMRQRLIEEVFPATKGAKKTPSELLGLALSPRGNRRGVDSLEFQKYRNFIYMVFRRCLPLFNGVVTMAYLSLANMVACLIVAIYMRHRSDAITGLYIYSSLSLIAFLIFFSGYCAMIYSYSYRTLFAMPLNRAWLQTMKDDNVDDFMDAIITRNAKVPQDIAFGLQSVLSIKLGKRLPAPNYNLSLGQIYRDLTLNLLNATGHLQFLLCAAENSISGQPSWVPDLSKDFPNYWLQPFGTSKAQYNQDLELKSSDSIWELDAEDTNNLTIRGQHICTITEVFKFQPTKNHYDETERDFHLHNIEIIRKLFCTNDTGFGKLFHFPGPLLRLFFSNIINFPGLPQDINPDHLSIYWNFIWSSQKLSTANALRLLTRKTGSTFHLFPYGSTLPLYMTMDSQQLLRIHIAICNDIVSTGRKLFAGSYPGPYGERQLLGICSLKAQIGDTVIMAPGLPSSIVARPYLRSMRLVSPAVAFDSIRQVGDGQEVAKCLSSFTFS